MNHSIPRLRHLTPRHRRRACQPQAECLENRQLLSAGILDPSFSSDGFTLAGTGGASAVQIQSDGKILVAGSTGGDFRLVPGGDFRLVRLNSDGSTDDGSAADSTPSDHFGTGGSVTTDFFAQDDQARDIAILPDPRIVVVGLARNVETIIIVKGKKTIIPNYEFGLVCYKPDGSLDTSFGPGGKVTTNISTYTSSDSSNKFDGAYAVIVQDDGKIVVGGETATGSSTDDVAMARYFTVDTTIDSGPYAGIYKAGWLDPTFGQGGIVQNHLANYDRNGIWDMAILRGDPNNFTDDIIVTMEDPFAGKWSVMETRYRLDGSFDTSFGGGRSAIETLAASGLVAWGMAVQPDGSAVMTGFTGNGSSLFLLRYTNTGEPDSTFGTGGIALFGNAGDRAYSIAIQPGGEIVTAGVSTTPGSFVARCDSSGTIDTTFGTSGDGFARDTFTNSGSSFQSTNSLVAQPDGKIIVVGSATTKVDRKTTRTDFLIARYQGDPVAPLSAANAAISSATSIGPSAATGSRSRMSVAVRYHPLSAETHEPGRWQASGQAELGLTPVQLDAVTTALPTARLAVGLSKRLRPALWFPSDVGLE